MAGIATTTKRDFSFMGKFLFVGMIVLLLAMVANMFLQIPALALTISALVIVVFSLFLLHDVSRIVNGGETNYVMATTGVYLSLFNIFANLLSAPDGVHGREGLTRAAASMRKSAPRGAFFCGSAQWPRVVLAAARSKTRDRLDVRGVRKHVDHARGVAAGSPSRAPALRRRARASPGCTRRRRCAAAPRRPSAFTSSAAPSRGGSISMRSKRPERREGLRRRS